MNNFLEVGFDKGPIDMAHAVVDLLEQKENETAGNVEKGPSAEEIVNTLAGKIEDPGLKKTVLYAAIQAGLMKGDTGAEAKKPVKAAAADGHEKKKEESRKEEEFEQKSYEHDPRKKGIMETFMRKDAEI